MNRQHPNARPQRAKGPKKAAMMVCLWMGMALPGVLQAKEVDTIAAVDPALERITIMEGHRLKTYGVTMRVDVVINGEKGSLSDLAPNMTVVAFTMEGPQTIRKIEVSGLPRGAAKRAEEAAVGGTAAKPAAASGVSQAELKSLADKLASTCWTYPFPQRSDSDTGKYWMRLNADGTVTASWHSMPGSWKVVAPDTLQLQITGHDISKGQREILRFDPGLTKLGSNHERITTPTEEMVNKISAPAGTR